MTVITDLPRAIEPAALAGKARDTLSLTWEERRWTRKRVTTTGGREVALALPTGSVLEPGAILAVAEDWYLAVEARPLVVPDDPAMSQLLSRLGMRWERREAVYAPLGGGGDD